VGLLLLTQRRTVGLLGGEHSIKDAVELVGHVDGGLDLVQPALTRLRVETDEIGAMAGAQVAELEEGAAQLGRTALGKRADAAQVA